jgi:3-oxoacyl-[acyl-carrier protein] reductase
MKSNAGYSDLSGKVCVVTGGSRGIGAATCLHFAANGAKVVVNGRNLAAIESVVSSIRSLSGQAVGVAADCTDPVGVEQLRKRSGEAFGPVDILVAFAGGSGEPIPVEQITLEKWRAVVDTNLTATFLTVKEFLPGMIERKRGVILTMASSAGRLPSGASAPYAAAKAGIIMFSKHVAQEVGRHGVRVNCIAPSAILTDRIKKLMPEEAQRKLATGFPLGSIGRPDDVAMAALFLSSDNSAWITGTTLDVAGGRIMV